MPDFHSQIFSLALDAFLLIGAVKLTIEQLIPLAVLFKKLKATTTNNYSLESDKLEIRDLGKADELAKITASLLAQIKTLNPSDRVKVITAIFGALFRDDASITQSAKALSDAGVADIGPKPDDQSLWPEVKARLERASRQ